MFLWIKFGSTMIETIKARQSWGAKVDSRFEDWCLNFCCQLDLEESPFYTSVLTVEPKVNLGAPYFKLKSVPYAVMKKIVPS